MNGSKTNRLFAVSTTPYSRLPIHSWSGTEEIDESTTIKEIVWRFSHYDKNTAGRIAFKQNPHFYHGLQGGLSDKATEYGRKFTVNPINDFNFAYFQKIETIYVLVDKSCRLFLDKPPIQRVFGNLWKPYRTVILKGEFSPRCVKCSSNSYACKTLSENWSQKTSSFATLERTKTTGIAPPIRHSGAGNRTIRMLTV